MADEIKNAFEAAYPDGPSNVPANPSKSSLRALGLAIQSVVDAKADAESLTTETTRAIAAEAAITETVDQLQSQIGAAIIGRHDIAPVRIFDDSGAGTWATDFDSGATLQTKTLVTGERIALARASAAETGIFVVQAAGAPVRALDADSDVELSGATFFVTDGSNKGKTYTCATPLPITVGTTALTFVLTSELDTDAIDAALDAALDAIGGLPTILPEPTGRFLIVDSKGFVGAEMGTTAEDADAADFTEAEIQSRNARAVGLSALVATQFNTAIARLVWAYCWLCEYGQSLSAAMKAWPAKSKTQPYNNVMLGPAAVPSGSSSTYGTFSQPATFNPLVAKVVTSSAILTDEQVAALGATDASRGEVIGIGAANFFKGLHNLHRGYIDDPDRALVVTAAGVGGLSIDQLDSGTYYDRLVDGATKVKAAADGLGATSGVLSFQWEQGEEDYDLGTSKATYKAAFLALYENWYSDVVVGVFGQTERPAAFIYQTSGSWVTDTDDLAISMAQLELSRENENVYLYGPSYPVTSKDDGHLDANGSRWMGMQAGKVMHKVLTLNQGWKPTQITKASWRNRSVLLEYHAPVPPLAFRLPYEVFEATDYTNKGFEVFADGVSVPIESVTIVADLMIKIVTTTALGGAVKVRYGGKTAHNGNGCVADSDGITARDVYEYDADSGDPVEAEVAELLDAPYPLNNFAVLQVITATAE